MAEDGSDLTIFPPPPPPANEQERLNFATQAIAAARNIGDTRGVDEILALSGLYPNAGAYWRALLAVPCRALKFTELLLTFSIDPTESHAKHKIKRQVIEHAVVEGKRNGASWIFHDPLLTYDRRVVLASMRVHPRDAALWLLSSPWAHLVPPSLKDFLESEQRAATPAPPPPPAAPAAAAAATVIDKTTRRRGRPNDASRRVTREMREALAQGKLTPKRLSKMPGKSLAVQFGASRETCEKARKTALLEVSENADK